MFQVLCCNCGNPKRVNSYYLKLYKHHFCCRECYKEYKQKHPEEFNGKHVHRLISDFVKEKQRSTSFSVNLFLDEE